VILVKCSFTFWEEERLPRLIFPWVFSVLFVHDPRSNFGGEESPDSWKRGARRKPGQVTASP